MINDQSYRNLLKELTVDLELIKFLHSINVI